METVSANSASNDVRAFKSFYKFLEEDDEIDANPAKRLRQPKVGQPNVKVATDDDLAKMLAVCGRDKLGRRDAAIISLIAYLGVRRADVCVIDLEHLELEAATLTIPTSKNRKPRTVPLHPEVVGRIDRYLRLRGERPGALFLPHRGERLKPNGVGQMIERRAKAAGVDVRAHAFRRRFAVDFWRRSGGNIVSLQYLGDWTSPAMPARYTASERSRLAAEDLRRAWGQ